MLQVGGLALKIAEFSRAKLDELVLGGMVYLYHRTKDQEVMKIESRSVLRRQGTVLKLEMYIREKLGVSPDASTTLYWGREEYPPLTGRPKGLPDDKDLDRYILYAKCWWVE